MRCSYLLLAGLIFVWGSSLAAAQQEEIAEATTDAVTRPAADKPDGQPALVELELWVLNLRSTTSADQWDAVSAEVANREEVAQRVRRLQEEGLVTRSRAFKTVMLEGHEFMTHQGIREPRIQSVNKTNFGEQMSLVYEPVGSMLSATTAVDSKGRVLCQLQVEETYLEDSETPIQRDKEGKTTTAPRFQTFTFKGLVACPDGAARVVMATAHGEKSEQPATILFMAARTLDK